MCICRTCCKPAVSLGVLAYTEAAFVAAPAANLIDALPCMRPLLPGGQGPHTLLSTHSALSGALLPVDFEFYAPQAQQVFLIGEMTHWLRGKLPMQRGDDGVWRLRLNLRHGQWVYKFEVDGAWLADPGNALQAEDGMGVGESHSYLFVGDGDWCIRPDVPQGQVLQLAWQSQRLGRAVPLHLYLPPGEAPEGGWPLLVLLHGHQTRSNQWLGNGRLPQYMDNLLQQEVVQPFAVVMPAGHEQVDMMRYGYFLVEELLPGLAATFPLSTDPARRGVAGMSIRRFGPLALALDHPQAFGWVAPINENIADHVLLVAPTLGSAPFHLQLYCTLEGCAYPRYQQLVQTAGPGVSYMRMAGEPTWRHWNGMTRELLGCFSDFISGRLPRRSGGT